MRFRFNAKAQRRKDAKNERNVFRLAKPLALFISLRLQTKRVATPDSEFPIFGSLGLCVRSLSLYRQPVFQNP